MKTSLVTGTMIAAMAAATVAQAHVRTADHFMQVRPSPSAQSSVPDSRSAAGTTAAPSPADGAHHSTPLRVADQQWVK